MLATQRQCVHNLHSVVIRGLCMIQVGLLWFILYYWIYYWTYLSSTAGSATIQEWGFTYTTTTTL